MGYNISDHKNGDTFPGVTFNMEVNSSPLDLTGATITMSLRKRNCENPVAKRYSTDVAVGGLTITDAANGEFTLDEQIISLDPERYYYDIKFQLASGSVKTYISGYWTITSGLNC